jgi:ATP-binding cassette subfamily B multidrug efflux pump
VRDHRHLGRLGVGGTVAPVAFGRPAVLRPVEGEPPVARGRDRPARMDPRHVGTAGTAAAMGRFLWAMRPYFRQVAGQLALGSAAGIVMNTAVVLPAILLGRAIDRALAFERGQAAAADVGWAALAFLGGVLLTEVPRMGKRWWLMTANARIRANVRADAYRGVLAWPLRDLERTPLGDLMARIVGDVEVLGVGVREFTIEMWDTLLFSLSFIVAMLVIDARLTALALIPVPLAMLLAHATGRRVAQRTTRAREASADLTSTLGEHLAGVRVLRLFGRASASVERVARLSREFARRNLALVRLKAGLQPVYATIMTSGVVLIVWQGSERVIAGAMTVGAFVAYLELFLRFVNRGHRIPQLVNALQSGAAAYVRLRPLLASALPVAGEPRFASFRAGHVAGIARRPGTIAGRRTGPAALSLRDVTFQYPGAAAPALRGLSLDIPAGALVAVTGPVGSGKSALARAILGVHPVTSGTVLLDGQGLHDLPTADRRGLIGYLPQDAWLFSGSVRQNIAFDPAGLGGDDGVHRRAIRLAGIADDVAGFPQGVDTQIGEAGVRISGGQRQRLGLARALAAAGPGPPALLVLDDPFSAVDVLTEAAIIASLRAAFGPEAPPEERATIVLCSHRLAGFPCADLVLVLDRGAVVEAGTHADLLAAGGLYARISRAQRAAESPAPEPAPR